MRNHLENSIPLNPIELLLLMRLQVAMPNHTVSLVIELPMRILLGSGHRSRRLTIEQPVEKTIDLRSLLHLYSFHIAFEFLCRLMHIVFIPHHRPTYQLIPLHLVLLKYLSQFNYPLLLHQPFLTDILQQLVLTIEIRQCQLLPQQIRLLKGRNLFLNQSVHKYQLPQLRDWYPFCFFDLYQCLLVQPTISLIGMVWQHVYISLLVYIHLTRIILHLHFDLGLHDIK